MNIHDNSTFILLKGVYDKCHEKKKVNEYIKYINFSKNLQLNLQDIKCTIKNCCIL